ncbi:MAG TPA: hypothetical protein VN030_13330 [Cellvibrio sp.]|nr:hypothetical protein [Cellvibrio sp.]
MQLSYDDIAALLPHGKAMCMISEVTSWDNTRIHCRSNRLGERANPLCDNGKLTSVLLIEYAAQAAGIHSALLNASDRHNTAAYIGSIKDIEILQQQVDNDLLLDIHAECLMSNASGAIYTIAVQQQESALLRGRLILSLPPG